MSVIAVLTPKGRAEWPASPRRETPAPSTQEIEAQIEALTTVWVFKHRFPGALAILSVAVSSHPIHDCVQSSQ